MDAKVDDFLNEIDEIAPPVHQNIVIKNVESCQPGVWQKCYDELTGFSYYWNTKTDQVTWNTPEDYKETKIVKTDKKRPGMYVPPKVAPLFPGISSVTAIPQESIKIYSIGESSSTKNTSNFQQKEAPKTLKRPQKKNSDSEDEKIVLISSYGSDTDSEVEEPEQKKSKNDTNLTVTLADGNTPLSEEEDDLDILAKIQKKAKELKELGGDLPPGVKEVVSTVKDEPKPHVKDKKETTSGFSLVAGYSDSEEESDETTEKTPAPLSHSTLFPIPEPIDVKDFIQPKNEDEPLSIENDFNSKAFKRKKRIGVALVNTVKKKNDNLSEERNGFGFNKDSNPEVSSSTNNVYPGFQKGGVMFVKSDILNPTIPIASKEVEKTAGIDDKKAEVEINKDEVDGMYNTLREKLVFLNVGSSTVSIVQTMVIQAETLFTAMNEGGLKLSYLQNWLKEMCSELVKLEKEATPDGWLLQWDRSHKRYYYQNLTTGTSQWEYPQPDLSTSDDAMDISTTPPPPAEPAITMSPPLPPTIRSPTPPPAPIISVEDTARSPPAIDVPLPPEQPLPKIVGNGEPLPPGVDLPDIVSFPIAKESQENSTKSDDTKSDDTLNSALDSFYSDIASIDPVAAVLPSSQSNEEKSTDENTQIVTEPFKKKKKAKAKLGPGLTMKKKKVSQLVEKWKNVQQHYND